MYAFLIWRDLIDEKSFEVIYRNNCLYEEGIFPPLSEDIFKLFNEKNKKGLYAKKAFNSKDEIEWLFKDSKYKAAMKYDEKELLEFLINKLL